MGSSSVAVRKYQVAQTAILYSAFTCHALTGSITSPSIPDLVEKLGCTTEDFAFYGLSLSGIAWLVGGLVWGPIIDRFLKYIPLLLGTCHVIIFFTTLGRGWTTYLWVYSVCSTLETFVISAADLTCNNILFSIWGSEANSPMQGLHAAWGLGFVLGPLLVRPFLGPDKQDDNSLANSTTTILPPADATSEPAEEARLQIAYSIVAVISLIVATGVFSFKFFVRRPEDMKLHLNEKDSMKKVFSLSAIANGDNKFAVVMLVFFGLFYFGNAGREGTFTTWLFSYAVDSALGFTKKEAALLDTAAKFAFLVGRIIATFVALVCPIQPMVFVEIYAVFFWIQMLFFFGTNSKTNLYILACFHNAFSAPIWAGGFNWTNQYIVVSGVVFVVMTIGSGLSNFAFSWITGWIFTYKNPGDVVYLLMVASGLTCILIVCMQVVASKHGVRFTQKEKEDAAIRDINTIIENEAASDNDGLGNEVYVLEKGDWTVDL